MINWHHTREVIETLEEIFPEEDLDEVNVENLREKLMVLTHYEDIAPKWTDEELSEILEGWKNFRENL